MTAQNISIIDKSKEIQSIKNKFGDHYWHELKAHKEAAGLWGVECNDHGVVLDRKKEVIVKVKSCIGKLSFAETNKGHWLLGLSAETAISGRGYAPSVWDSFGFASYWDARAFGVEKLVKFFMAEAATTNSCSSRMNKANASEAVKILRAERTPQMNLF